MSIVKRTVFMGVDEKKGMIFKPWAKVETTLGTMFEPYQFNRVHSQNSNPADELTMISDIQRVDYYNDYNYLTQGVLLVGGPQMPEDRIA